MLLSNGMNGALASPDVLARGAQFKVSKASHPRPRKPRQRIATQPQAGFKISHHVPSPVSAKGFAKSKQTEWRSLGLPVNDEQALKLLLVNANQIVDALHQAESKQQTARLVIYRPGPACKNKEMPEVLTEIAPPGSTLKKKATHPISYAAQAIQMMLADLPGHIPPAFIFRFLNPVYQHQAKRLDPERFPEESRHHAWWQVPAEVWGNFRSKKADPARGIDNLEFSPEEYRALAMNAYPRFLALRVDHAEENYPAQLLCMLSSIQAALRQANDPALLQAEKLSKARLGLARYALDGSVSVQDLSHCYPALKHPVKTGATIDRSA